MRPSTKRAQQTDVEAGSSSSGKAPKKNTNKDSQHSDITAASQSEDSGKESGKGVTILDAEQQNTSQSKTPEAEAIDVVESGKDWSSNSLEAKDPETERETKHVEHSDAGKEDIPRLSSSVSQRLVNVQVTKVRISFSFVNITRAARPVHFA